MDEKNRKIGQAAELLGTSTRTLRYYEELGLVQSRRSKSGTRYYQEDDIRRLSAILSLGRNEIPLGDIQILAEIRQQSATGQEASHQVDALLNRWKDEIGEKISQLQKLQQDLENASSLVQKCFHCSQPPRRYICSACPVTEELDCAETLQVIWEQKE